MENNQMRELQEKLALVTNELESSKKQLKQQEKEIAQYNGAYSPVIEKKMESNLAMQMAQFFAQSTIVPIAYQQNPANCFIAINMANRLGADPFQVMQSLNIIQGRPSWSAQFIIAAINQSGRFKTQLNYKVTGNWSKQDFACIAYATANDGTLCESIAITYQIAKAEGWLDKKGSKWLTMPELMARYRAASFFGRQYCPELLLGILSTEETKEIIDAEMVENEYIPKTTEENKNKSLGEVQKEQTSFNDVIKVDENTGEVASAGKEEVKEPAPNEDDWMK